MTDRSVSRDEIEIHPLTPERWADFELLFGARGACGGCWCMWWRVRRSQFLKQKGPGNRRAMKRLVELGDAPGLLAYAGDRPVGWIALAPRERYETLDRSRVLARLDDSPVWSVVCFFVAREYRRKGLTVALLKGAVAHAAKHGARIIEGYPVDSPRGKVPDVFAYTGLAAAFGSAGFAEAGRRSPTRPIMRYLVAERRASRHGRAKKCRQRSGRS